MQKLRAVHSYRRDGAYERGALYLLLQLHDLEAVRDVGLLDWTHVRLMSYRGGEKTHTGPPRTSTKTTMAYGAKRAPGDDLMYKSVR